MSRTFKFVATKASVTSLISDAYSEFSSLKEEIEEWKGNMENANMEHMPKYEELETCFDEIETIADNEPTNPPAHYDPEVEFSQMVSARKGRPLSRANRCSAACGMLEAVISKIEEDMEEEGITDDRKAELEELRDHLQSDKDEAENVNFPGMY